MYLFYDFHFNRTSTGALVADASDLGFATGVTPPDSIAVQGESGSTTYHRFMTAREDGEVLGWTYRSKTHGKLVVFND